MMTFSKNNNNSFDKKSIQTWHIIAKTFAMDIIWTVNVVDDEIRITAFLLFTIRFEYKIYSSILRWLKS